MKTQSLSVQSGFTLIEMVIVIGIIGVLIGSFVGFYQPTQTAQATVETQQKIERVLNSLASFALMNNRLPCSANPTTNPIDGVAQATCNGIGNSDMGIIPYATLGLSQDDAKDAFGYYLTYIVNRNAANSPTGGRADALTSRFCDTANTNMNLVRNNTTETSRLVVAVISHGPDGIGSYNMAALNSAQRNNPINDINTLGGNSTDGERGNAVNATGFTTSDRTDINDYNAQAGTNHFDDIVGTMTGVGLITRMGGAYCH